jgi:hypothetical protein
MNASPSRTGTHPSTGISPTLRRNFRRAFSQKAPNAGLAAIPRSVGVKALTSNGRTTTKTGRLSPTIERKTL